MWVPAPVGVGFEHGEVDHVLQPGVWYIGNRTPHGWTIWDNTGRMLGWDVEATEVQSK